ncbi:MAG: hypothetical protein Q4A96_02495 [Candidatus Saccharibacteria bacterium]|nr:hypothetical protein [Candidatus Saccharibacteria bacterium]
MSEKGGASDKDQTKELKDLQEEQIEDFDSETSSVEKEMRERIEKAENDQIEESSKKDEESKEHFVQQNSTTKIVLMSVFTTLFGIVFILALVAVGIGIGQSSFWAANKKNEVPNEQVVEVISVDYGLKSYTYSLGDKERSTEERGYLMSEYGSNDNYAIIKTMAQLERLESIYQAHGANNADFAADLGVNASFFSSGSVIALATEKEQLGNIKVSGVSRDENYNINATLSSTYCDKRDQRQLRGGLVLIKIDNIQPQKVSLQEVESIYCMDAIIDEAPEVEEVAE